MKIGLIGLGRLSANAVRRIVATASIPIIGVLAAILLTCSNPARGLEPDRSFHALMDGAAARMHAAMHVMPSGDADRDFARMMVPHHQGGIDMAMAELQFGKDERLRRLAQEIIITQTQEIAVMRQALGEPAPVPPGRGR